MATTSDLFRGCFIRFNNELVQVIEYEHRTPGNLRAFYQVKMRSTKNGRILENRFRAGESVDMVRVEVHEYQYLYRDGDSLVCMDNETYEQIYVDSNLLGDSLQFLKEGIILLISFEEGSSPIFAEMPGSVVLEVTYTEPGIKGDTATNTLKAATLETGAEIRVPLFVNTGEKIKVDTKTGAYMERVKEGK